MATPAPLANLRPLIVLALVLTAVSMCFGAAHVLAMRPKLRMSAELYLAVQQLYRGWAWAGVPLVGALVTSTVLAMRLQAAGRPAVLVFAAAALIALSLAIFFAFTFSGEPRDAELDRAACHLGGAAAAMGVQSRGGRSVHCTRARPARVRHGSPRDRVTPALP